MADTPLYVPTLEERSKFTDYRKGIWGDSFNWYGSRSWDQVKYAVIHHSVTNPTNDSKSDVDYIAYLHKQRGWGGVGYHFIITADGMVWYVGDISTMRANVADKNHEVIGICLVGDFTKGNPTDDQILSAHDLCEFLLFNTPSIPNLKDWGQLTGHKELQATQCPGTYWKGVDDSIFERIKNRIPYTPQPLPEPIIDWETRYHELAEQKNKEVGVLTAQISLSTEELSTLKAKLADQIVDCQEEKERILENASVSDFPDNEVLNQAVKLLFEKIKKLWKK